MGVETIDKWSLRYWLLQRCAILISRLFYKRYQVNNIKNFLRKEPVILAPNHQNALMDAMAFVNHVNAQPVFLARADVFKPGIITNILTIINILPVYRIRDGISNVKRNDEIFDRTMQIFKNKYNPLVVFPEGNHGDKRRLRPILKGIFRIAFQAQEELGDTAGVKIIPLGLDYSNYEKERSTILINFGEAIEVKDYYQAYLEDSIKGINLIKDRLAAEMTKYMIDIQTEEYYDCYDFLRDIKNKRGRNLMQKLREDKKLIQSLNTQLEKNEQVIKHLDSKVKACKDLLGNLHLLPEVLYKSNYSLLGIGLTNMLHLVLLPIFLLGFVNNYIPYCIIQKIVRKKVKDPQFRSSFKYVLYLIFLPVFYLLFLIPMSFIDVSIWYKVGYFVCMPFSGIIALDFAVRFKKLYAKLRYALKLRINNKSAIQLRQYRNEIMDKLSSIHDTSKK